MAAEIALVDQYVQGGCSYEPLLSDLSPLSKIHKESSVQASMTERAKAGLISGRDISNEIANAKRDECLRFQEMDPSLSGRSAEPVYRDKKGQRISKGEYLKSKQKVEEKSKEKNLKWGKGLAQKREAEAKLQELKLEKGKPFAWTRDDPEVDIMMKERVRWGDPMAYSVKVIPLGYITTVECHYRFGIEFNVSFSQNVEKIFRASYSESGGQRVFFTKCRKKYSEQVIPNLGDDEKMKESGFVVPQEIPPHSFMKRGFDAVPNRYSIRPGRHWDGVDRSNGFEKQMFKKESEKQATEREAYLWSVSDM